MRTFLLFVLTMLTLLGAAPAHAERLMAPDFTGATAKGGRLALEDLRGRVVALNFWATWCAPCRAEMPWFQQLADKYADRGLTVVGVAMDERGWPAVTPFLNQYDIDYPIILGSRSIALAYAPVEPLPTTVFLDRHGRIVARHHGLIPPDHLERVLESLLAEGYNP